VPAFSTNTNSFALARFVVHFFSLLRTSFLVVLSNLFPSNSSFTPPALPQDAEDRTRRSCGQGYLEGDDQYWGILHSLARSKPTVAVLPTSGWKKLRPAVGKVLEVEKPPKLPFTCNCKICWGQYFPASIFVTNQEAHQLVSSLVVDARQDLDFLRQILAEHADFIVTRWKKKSREKRSIFLSENVDIFDKKFAAIHLLHMRSSPENCDFNDELMRSLQGMADLKSKEWLSQALHNSRVSKMTTSYQDTWLLPYLDSETLSEDPSLLLALLHHRTTHEPED
jgi:hypothetical protein